MRRRRAFDACRLTYTITHAEAEISPVFTPTGAQSLSSKPRANSLSPILLIQGWGLTMDAWNHFPRRLAISAGRPVVTFDNRGVGESGTPPEQDAYTIEQLADDARVVLKSAVADLHAGEGKFPKQLSRPHVLGISMGGMIAQELAFGGSGDGSGSGSGSGVGERSISCVASMILGCTTHGGRTSIMPDMSTFTKFKGWDSSVRRRRREMAVGFLERGFTREWLEGNPELFAAVVDCFMSRTRSERGMNAQAAALGRFNSVERLYACETPGLVIHSPSDAILPFGNGQLIAEKLNERCDVYVCDPDEVITGGGRRCEEEEEEEEGCLVTLPEDTCGHFWWHTCGDDTIERIAQFVKDNDDG